jgi:hypothetical protein
LNRNECNGSLRSGSFQNAYVLNLHSAPSTHTQFTVLKRSIFLAQKERVLPNESLCINALIKNMG